MFTLKKSSKMKENKISGKKCLEIMDKALRSGLDQSNITIVSEQECISFKDMFGVKKVIKGDHDIDSDILPGIYIWDKENFLEGHDPDVIFMTTNGGLIGLYRCVEDTVMSSCELFARENVGKYFEVYPTKKAIVVGFCDKYKSIIVAAEDTGWTDIYEDDVILINAEYDTYLYIEVERTMNLKWI